MLAHEWTEDDEGVAEDTDVYFYGSVEGGEGLVLWDRRERGGYMGWIGVQGKRRKDMW